MRRGQEEGIEEKLQLSGRSSAVQLTPASAYHFALLVLVQGRGQCGVMSLRSKPWKFNPINHFGMDV